VNKLRASALTGYAPCIGNANDWQRSAEVQHGKQQHRGTSPVTAGLQHHIALHGMAWHNIA